jgi:serine/threonine protein kinase
VSGSIELIKRLSGGDTSTIYLASDGGTRVALKVLHAHLASDPIVRARFLREGELLATIRHPNIIRVHDVMEIDGQPAMVMELLTGGTLRGRIINATEALLLARTLADALGAIHSRGIVHRDLRPEHVLFDDHDSPRIIDFGMASVKDLSGLTRSTVFTARPEFVDPHTWGRGRALPVQDIYSLGAILHTVIMGKAPSVRIFARTDDPNRELMLAEMRTRAGSPLGEVVTAMLDTPARRPRSAAEIIDWMDRRSASGARRLSQCLYCSSVMPMDAPICLDCARPPLQIRLDPEGEFIVLRKISEAQDILGPFLAKLRILSDGPLGNVQLILGDARLYSRAEQKAGLRLPFRLAEGIHPASVGPLIAALKGPPDSKIQITRYPMARTSRFKRGPLMTLREGRILPEATRSALRRLAEPDSSRARPDSATSLPGAAHRPGDTDLRTECKYAVAIASASLATDPTTEHLADAEHVARLWDRLAGAVDGLEKSFLHLAGVQLQELYADLERLETSETSAGGVQRQEERERLLALFQDFGDAEREAAALEQRIISACRLLERISPATAVEELREVEKLLGEQIHPG